MNSSSTEQPHRRNLRALSTFQLSPFAELLELTSKLTMMMLPRVLIAALPALALAFTPTSLSGRVETQLYDGDGTGGWGIGTSRSVTPEEYARSDRAHFDGYQMREQGDFRRQIAEDKEAIKKSELEELLGVANIAGLRVKDPSERLAYFEEGVVEDDDLDLSV